MRLLQRYILWELLRVFAFLLSVLTVLLVFVGIFREVTQNGLGPFQVLQILPYVVPSLLPFTVPATLLLTVCMVYGRAAGDREITAAKAAGINVMSLLWPAFLLGAVFSLCSLVLTDQLIPWAVANIHRTVTLAMEDIFLDVLRKQHQISDKHLGFSITVMGVDGKKLVMPTFQYAPPGHSSVTVQAQEATLEFDLDQHQVILHLRHGHIDTPGRARIWFDHQDQPFPLPSDIRPLKPRHISIVHIEEELDQLKNTVATLRQRRDVETALALSLGEFDRLFSGKLTNCQRQCDYVQHQIADMKTEIHSRFALACSCFCFTLLGAPFAILQGRRQFFVTFFICFVPILVGYYPLVLGLKNLSAEGFINPAWAMWVGNALVLTAAWFVLRKVLRH